MANVLSNGRLVAVAKGDGWDVQCPQCGTKTHVQYQVVNAQSLMVDFIGSGGILSSFVCPNQTYQPVDSENNPIGDVGPCGYTATNVQLQAS